MKPTTYVGISLSNGVFHVARRRADRDPASISFPSDERGTEMLKRYVADLRGPVRLAMAMSAASIGIALALGEPPEREIFLVSPLLAEHPAALVNFVKRPV